MLKIIATVAAVLSAASTLATAPTADAVGRPPCSRIYYLGTASRPSQLQLYCNAGATLFRVNAPYPKHPNMTGAGGVRLSQVYFVAGEARMFFTWPGHNCVAIRTLASQSPAAVRLMGSC